jgi:hypothetical protein
MALVEVIVRDRRDFPAPIRPAFRRFVESRFPIRLSVEFRGEPGELSVRAGGAPESVLLIPRLV